MTQTLQSLFAEKMNATANSAHLQLYAQKYINSFTTSKTHRLPLSTTVLRLKVTSSPVLDDVTALLAECLQPPPPAAVREAFNELLEAGTIAVCWLPTVSLSAVYLRSICCLSVCLMSV
jgi:hypothetical protein